MDDRVLMGIRADTLFRYDARGRMVCSNEPDGRPAPRLFLGRTTAGRVLRFGEALPVAVARRLTEIIERQPPVGARPFPPLLLAAEREALESHAPIPREGGGPAYRFPEGIAHTGEVVPVTRAYVEVVRQTFPWLYRELADWGPCFAVVRDGVAVSVCFGSRIGVAAAEAGVETLPDYRGRGLAAAVTAAWGASIRASDRVPLYSTGWDNAASQAVAGRVGLVMFGTDATWA